MRCTNTVMLSITPLVAASSGAFCFFCKFAFPLWRPSCHPEGLSLVFLEGQVSAFLYLGVPFLSSVSRDCCVGAEFSVDSLSCTNIPPLPSASTVSHGVGSVSLSEDPLHVMERRFLCLPAA